MIPVPPDELRAFGVFEGGGAKGLAHIGALAAAEDLGVVFVGVAGASAGAIVATLVAAGYRANELYDPAHPEAAAFPSNLLDLLNAKVWNRIERLKRAFKEAKAKGGLRPWLRFGGSLVTKTDLILRMLWNRGLLETTNFEAWLERLLLDRVGRHGESSKSVTFAEFKRAGRVPLKIVTTDFANERIKIFDAENTPDEHISAAVAASISIPFVFRPRRLAEGLELVDGGLLSNFPAWLFDRERLQEGPNTPTFGFTLVEEKGRIPTRPPRRLIPYVKALATTAINGDPQLETRAIESLYLIRIEVRVGTTDFDLNPDQKNDLYRAGLEGAKTAFKLQVGPKNPGMMRRRLKAVHAQMLQELRTCFPDLKPAIHMRVNVILRTSRGTLRVRYSYNMDGDQDTDDLLELSDAAGASGRCLHGDSWLVVCDLVKARKTFASEWKMTKYEQALVREDLRSLLSVRIPAYLGGLRVDFEKPIGVLNFDSCDAIFTHFQDRRIQRTAWELAKTIAVEMGS